MLKFISSDTLKNGCKYTLYKVYNNRYIVLNGDVYTYNTLFIPKNSILYYKNGYIEIIKESASACRTRLVIPVVQSPGAQDPVIAHKMTNEYHGTFIQSVTKKAENIIYDNQSFKVVHGSYDSTNEYLYSIKDNVLRGCLPRHTGALVYVFECQLSQDLIITEADYILFLKQFKQFQMQSLLRISDVNHDKCVTFLNNIANDIVNIKDLYEK